MLMIFLYLVYFKCCSKYQIIFSTNFDMKDLDKVNMILGVKIWRREDRIIFSQEHYVERFIKKLNVLRWHTWPLFMILTLNWKKSNDNLVVQSKYAQNIGNLLYLMRFTRHDITYVVCILSRYTHNSKRALSTLSINYIFEIIDRNQELWYPVQFSFYIRRVLWSKLKLWFRWDKIH